MFVFDTDVYSNVVKKSPSEPLLDRLARVPRREQFTTTITIAETYYGIMRSSNRARLLALFEDVLLPRATILSFDFSAAKKYGEIRSSLEKQGEPLAHADLQIAAIALAADMTLVTGNVKHFQKVPDLAVENWLV